MSRAVLCAAVWDLQITAQYHGNVLAYNCVTLSIQFQIPVHTVTYRVYTQTADLVKCSDYSILGSFSGCPKSKTFKCVTPCSWAFLHKLTVAQAVKIQTDHLFGSMSHNSAHMSALRYLRSDARFNLTSIHFFLKFCVMLLCHFIWHVLLALQLLWPKFYMYFVTLYVLHAVPIRVLLFLYSNI